MDSQIFRRLLEGRVEPILILDVRESDEFRDESSFSEYVGCYVNLPLTILAVLPADEVWSRLDASYQACGSGQERMRIVAICRSGSRSALAVDILAKQGIAAENLDGGMLAFRSLSRDVSPLGT